MPPTTLNSEEPDYGLSEVFKGEGKGNIGFTEKDTYFH